MKLLVPALLSLLLVPLESAAGPPQSAAGGKFHSAPPPAPREELLGELPPEIKPLNETNGSRLTGFYPSIFYLSPDGRRFAAIGRTNKNRWLVVIDGKAGPEFEELAGGAGVTSVSFSPNSKHVIYSGFRSEKGWIVVLDGQELPHGAHLSHDFEHFAYITTRGSERYVMVVEGQEGPEFRQIGEPVFSPDSQHMAYAARRGQKWIMVVDGKEGTEFQDVRDPMFSPDSQHIAYYAERGQRGVMVLDGKEGPEFEYKQQEGYLQPMFSPDSEHMAYRAKRGQKWIMVVDGKEGPEFEEMRDPLFSFDSQHVAYRANRGKDKWVIVLDGQAGSEFSEIAQGWRLSRDGKHLAYKAKTSADKWTIVLDGQPGPEFDNITKGPFFSPEGDRLAYEVLQGGKDFVMFDNKRGTEYDAPFPTGINPEYAKLRPEAIEKSKGRAWRSGSSVGELVFSPNGQRLSYVARRGEKFVVSQDGQEGPDFPFILTGPVFSPDSRHILYIAWEPNAISPIFDGNATKKIAIPEGKPLYTAPREAATVDRHTAWDDTAELSGFLPFLPVFVVGEVFTGMAAKKVNFVEHVTFSADSQHLAYVVCHGGHSFNGDGFNRAQRRVVLDGQEGRLYDADALFNLTFSADGRHFAFEVHRANRNKSFVVVDGRAGKPYDELLSFKPNRNIMQGSLRFDDDHSVTYLAREGRKFYRVTQPLP